MVKPMNFPGVKDITNHNQRMPVMVHTESTDRRAAQLTAQQEIDKRARMIIHKTDRSTRRSRSASQDSERELEAMHDQIEANEAVQNEFDTRVNAIGQAATDGGLDDRHSRRQIEDEEDTNG